MMTARTSLAVSRQEHRQHRINRSWDMLPPFGMPRVHCRRRKPRRHGVIATAAVSIRDRCHPRSTRLAQKRRTMIGGVPCSWQAALRATYNTIAVERTLCYAVHHHGRVAVRRSSTTRTTQPLRTNHAPRAASAPLLPRE